MGLKLHPAIAQIQASVETKVPSFLLKARVYVLQYLQQHGPATSEELTLACKKAGIIPHDDRAFGPVYMDLERRCRIVRLATVKRPLRSHNSDGGHLWKAR
jgi:hypothetical protein